MSPEKSKYHTYLALYACSKPHFFDGNLQKNPNIRKCVELPFQQTKAQLLDEVTDTLCNLERIHVKEVTKITCFKDTILNS